MKKAGRSASTDDDIELCETDPETTCSVCYAEFLDSDDLEVHIQQVHPSGKLVNCQFCEKVLPDAELYMLHIRDVHLLDFISCSACTRIFTHWSDMKKHESKHPHTMKEGSFSCSQCSEFFMFKEEMQQHEFTNHYKADGVLLNNYFSLLSAVINMNFHVFIKSMQNEENRKRFMYMCGCCGYRDSNLEEYITHLRKKNCRSFTCDKCCNVFKTKASLVTHIQNPTKCYVVKEKIQSKLKQKECVKCKKYFNSSEMKNHDCIPILKCCNCDSVYKSMYELSEHQAAAHPLAIKLLVCQFCRKECVGTVSLEKHIQRSHEHEFHLYKYTCMYCDITFKHPQKLFAHYLLKHKDIEPYLCKICDKKFRVRKAFTLHIKLQHKSKGFVEFDERLHVFFTDKKSEKPFQPVSKFVKEKPADTNNDKSEELELRNMESDVNQTENEGNQTDAKDAKVATGRARKRKKEEEVLELSDCDSDDEPLVVVKKKAKFKSQLRNKPLQFQNRKRAKKSAKRQFTCEVCKKYCYTFQNYQHHVSLHFKDESKKCIKCSLAFKTKVDLERHMKVEHSSSQLTETLKSILERKKKGEKKQEMTVGKKIQNTIKKVVFEKDDVTATLRPIDKELSVQKFIESFTPEETKNAPPTDNISLTRVTNPVEREPLIKMIKFKPAPEINESTIKLSMPVKFRRCNEVHTVTVKKILPAANNTYDYDEGNQFQDDNDFDNRDANIPEPEQEVTLEGTDEAPKRNPATHKIVIPKLPKELKSVRIAHLLPEAPYYKIVKVADIIKNHQEKQKQESIKETSGPPPEVRLPDGTKLVHVNPLAHLLGDTPVEQIVKPSKYYKPSNKSKNFEEVLANALKKLDSPRPRVRKAKGEKIVMEELKLPEEADQSVDKTNGDTEKTESANNNDGKEDKELSNVVEEDETINKKSEDLEENMQDSGEKENTSNDWSVPTGTDEEQTGEKTGTE